MPQSLSKTLSALALSVVLAVSALGASTTQARADADDAARIIGGIIALYAIGRALESNNNHGYVTQQYHHNPRRVAPARCFREFRTPHGYFRGYAERCLQRHVSFGLPDACQRRFHTEHGWRVFYGGRCMRQHGWVRGH